MLSTRLHGSDARRGCGSPIHSTRGARSMTIAITAASGQLGRLVVEQLARRTPAADVVALVRSPDKAADMGVEVREADYDRPETFDRALAGVRTLFLISGPVPGKRVAQHRNVIAAA